MVVDDVVHARRGRSGGWFLLVTMSMMMMMMINIVAICRVTISAALAVNGDHVLGDCGGQRC